MIYPTRGAVLAAAAGAPVALVVAVFLPGAWYAGLAWPVAVLLLCVVDAATGARTGSVRVSVPASASVGASIDLTVRVAIDGAVTGAEVAVAADPLLAVENDGRLWVRLTAGKGAAAFPVTTRRRGTVRIARLWLRWRGRFGFVWKQTSVATDAAFPVLPDIRAVHERGAAIFQRHALQGLIAQIDRGDGTDFDALVEYRSGMDRRAIDWKQSARHHRLHAKEFRSERNNQIVFAVDCGRQMSDPVGGLPRVDRAISAVLLTAWIALKLGDRVSLTAFDSRPRIAGGFVAGTSAFAELQHLAARIDYSQEEANYTFALTSLATRLTRRSMIVLFTEFTDLTTADFLVRGAARIVNTHLMLVVVLRDEELEAIIDRAPETADDITRAVTAAGLLKDRLIVLTRLRHLGVHVVESEHDRVAERLVAAYVDLKRRNLL